MSARPMMDGLILSSVLSVLWACTPTDVDQTPTTNSPPTVLAGGENLQGVALDDATALLFSAAFRSRHHQPVIVAGRRRRHTHHDQVSSPLINSVRLAHSCRATTTGIATSRRSSVIHLRRLVRLKTLMKIVFT